MRTIKIPADVLLIDSVTGERLRSESGNVHPPLAFAKWVAMLLGRQDLWSHLDVMEAHDLCSKFIGKKENDEVGIDERPRDILLGFAKKPLNIPPVIALCTVTFVRALDDAK